MRDVGMGYGGRTVGGIVAVAALLTGIVSCGLLLPQRGRENPLDPQSPVALITGLAAETLSVDAAADTASVRLTWEVPADVGDRAPITVLLVRNESARPRGKDDGIVISAAAGDLQYDDEELLPGKVYWYAAWCTRDDEEYVGPTAPVAASTMLVSPLATFTATATAADTVQLEWTLPTDDPPVGIAVVRKDDADPESPVDGVQIPVVLANGRYVDTVGSGKVYHYAAWAHDALELQFAEPARAEASTVIPAAIGSLSAIATAPDTVLLTWTVPTTNAPSSMTVRRTVGSDPTGPDDGDAVSVTMSSGEYTDTGLTADVQYHYAAWGMNGLVPGARAVDTADTTFSWLDLLPTIDGYVYEDTGFGGYLISAAAQYLLVRNYTDYRQESLLKFSSVSFPSYWQEARLYLYCYDGYGYLNTVERIVQDWGASVTFATAAAAGFVTTDGKTTFTPASGANTVDVTAIAQTWASGSASNYGVRLRRTDSDSWSSRFYSNEGTTKPALEFYCSEEYQP